VSDKGFRVAESPRWAYNPVFRGARGLLQMTIGGDTHFTPEEVADRITDVIRVLLSHEGIIIAVRGPDGRTNYAHSRRGAAKNERRRLKVDAALHRFCTERHVTYDQTATPLWASDIDLAGNRVGDGLHANARWHERAAELIAETITRALMESGRTPPTLGSPVEEAARSSPAPRAERRCLPGGPR
jgi:hypothetical protein